MQVNGFPGLIWTTGKSFLFTAVAGTLVQELKESADALMGSPIAQFFGEAQPVPTPLDAHRRALAGVRCQFEAEVNGRILCANLSPLRGEDGTILGVAGTAVDITERAVTELSLRLAERSSRSLIEQAPYAICRATLSGTLLQVNPAMVVLLDYESEEDLLLCSLQSDVFAAISDYEQFVKDFGGPVARYGFESTWRMRNRETVPVSLGGRAVRDDAGNFLFFEILAESIGQRKQLEAQLQQSQKMQAVGQLAGGIAHDFNNLLTVIQGRVDLALSQIPATDALRPHLVEVETAAQRAAALTRQLLAFGRMQPVQERIIDLNATVQGVVQIMRRLIGTGVMLEFRPGASLGAIKADPVQIEQVLMNLAVNARDAMPDGGHLIIETTSQSTVVAVQDPIEPAPGSYSVCEVRDTGIGMSPQTLQRIYEPFFTTKNVGEGTGLGLFTVYGIVRGLKGFIQVKSEIGQGTRFRIFFPAISETAIPREVEAPVPVPNVGVKNGTETILLAEDQDAIRELFSSFLSKLGYHVIGAVDGLEALERAREIEGKIDLLVTDLVMPRLGGRELATEIRQQYPHVKIILMTGYAGSLAALKALEQDGASLLQKPFSCSQMSAKIREILDAPAS